MPTSHDDNAPTKDSNMPMKKTLFKLNTFHVTG